MSLPNDGFSPEAADANRICVGVITGAHGMGGAVKVKSYTADPKDIAVYDGVTDKSGERRFELRVVRSGGKALIVKIDGVDDRTKAEALKGTEMYVSRTALPQLEEDEFYYSDLVGLEVELADGSKFGVVRLVGNYGAGDVMEIEMADGKTVFFPFTKAVVPVVDFGSQRMVINLPNEISERDVDEEGTEE